MKTLWCKNHENPNDRISHAWAPLKKGIKESEREGKQKKWNKSQEGEGKKKEERFILDKKWS